MHIAVGLTALAIKSFLWLRTMTPRDAMILQIAAFALLVLMLTIMGGCTPERKNDGTGPFCPYETPPDVDYPMCMWKLRNA